MKDKEMTNKDLESVIYCPQCGEQTALKLARIDGSVFDKLSGIIAAGKAAV